MILTLAERLSVGSLLPEQGDFLTMNTSKSIIDIVQLNDDEKVIFEKNRQDGTLDNVAEELQVNVEFNDSQYELLNSQISKLDSQNKITWPMLSICNKLRDEICAHKAGKAD